MGRPVAVTDAVTPHVTSRSCKKVKAPKYEVALTDAARRRYSRKVTALPIESDHLPPVPNTVAGIRALLPANRRAEFDAELLAAVDTENLDKIRAFRERWWILAAFETDPALHNIPEGEQMFPSPIPR